MVGWWILICAWQQVTTQKHACTSKKQQRKRRRTKRKKTPATTTTHHFSHSYSGSFILCRHLSGGTSEQEPPTTAAASPSLCEGTHFLSYGRHRHPRTIGVFPSSQGQNGRISVFVVSVYGCNMCVGWEVEVNFGTIHPHIYSPQTTDRQTHTHPYTQM